MGGDDQRDDDAATLREVVDLVHRHLGLDAVGIVEVRGDRGVVRAWAGRPGLSEGAVNEMGPRSYPGLVLSGAVPALIEDARNEPLVADLPLTRFLGVRSYVGVPLLLSDGRPYGVLAGVSCAPATRPTARDVTFMEMLGELIRKSLDRGRHVEDVRTHLQDIISNERLAIAYQPIVDLASGHCLGAEALARFPGSMRTDEMFQAATEVALGVDLESLAVSKAWGALGVLADNQFLAVNVSPEALLTLAPRADARHEVALDRVVVELTEHSLVDSYELLRRLLAPLKERGLRLAVDDAGAGYASLRHVVELRPDFIKVDVSLVRGVADDPVRQITIKSIATLAEELGATLIAEGVEEVKDLEAIRALGVGAVQGYLLDRPSTDPADLERWSGTRAAATARSRRLRVV
ncbi:MAG TPA: EAL domain-containing protein [Acidimicrobiales bacterium]|nr:EAL domain-containing protein [Acidimicrobiales bacterium]